MTTPVDPVRPSTGRGAPQRTRRLVGIDAARALAIIGMIAVNVGPRGEPGVGGLILDLPVGRASVLFVVLAGVGISLLTRSARRPDGSLPWRTLLWRAALLFAGGLALQELGHGVSVILQTYGVLFLLALPLVRARSGIVVGLMASLAVLGPVAWIGLQMATGVEFTFEAPALTDPPQQLLTSVLVAGPYPVVVWCVPFLFGMLLGRADLSDSRIRKRLAWWGAGTAVGGYLLSRILTWIFGEPAPEVGWDRLMSAVGHSEMPLWLVSSVGSAAFVIGALLLAEPVVARWLPFLVSAGKLSLTIYVAHLVVLAAWIRPGPHTLAEGYLVTAVLTAALMVLAHLWTRFQPVGPLERLLRLPAGRR